MISTRRVLPICLGLNIALLASVMDGEVQADEVNFNRDIRPLLADRCFHCHGPAEESREAGLRLDKPQGEEGAYRTVDGTAAISPGSLEKSAVWQRITSEDEEERMPPADANKKPLTAAEQALIKQWIESGAKFDAFWSFAPPKRTDPPPVCHEEWKQTEIDGFVSTRLKKAEMQPKPRADKRTLIRRVTFDLTGLPPTVEEIHRFLADDKPDAYERLVDELLKRPAYGEHMARYWADLVRLADTNGMHKDFYRNFSAYRSWLIRAFNSNLPYDEFVRFQIAGDLYESPTNDQFVASGFNRLHLIIDKGTALPEESHHKNVLDRVEAFGTAFLGLTVQCAQCHEHKYDPISQKEFYQLYAFFNNFDGAPETNRAPKGGIQPPFIKLDTSSELAMVMKERSAPKPTHILIRGSYEDPGEQVQRDTPSFLPPLRRADAESATRMDLAEWLVSNDHPLTARVAVNRFWQQFFGVGLVKTSEDFGAQGEWPSHPQLLDNLAIEFRASGWNIKELVRAIVLSQTYCQSSNASADEFKHDPENRLLSRGPRFRLDAEMIRDQILFVSGKLNQTMYGESVKPPQPPGLWKAVSMAAPFTYVADKGDKIYRRSFYTYWRRAMPPPAMTILNAPSREYCAARRERTNTPLQALLLMNEQEFFNAAKSCATNALQEEGSEQERLVRLYEKLTSHLPSDKRLALMKSTVDSFRELYREEKQLVEQFTPELSQAKLEERIELAAWTMMAHSLLNLELTKVKR